MPRKQKVVYHETVPVVKPPVDDRPSVIPRAMQLHNASMTMGELIRDQSQADRDSMDRFCGRRPDEFEWIGTLVLPPFQRPAVWTQEQQVRFIESVWNGYDIGRYVVYQPHHPEFSRFTDCVIDGQQRIRAILAYVNSEFPVLGYRWSELPRVDKRRFEMITFNRACIRETMSEAQLRDMYNRMNYGGTPHTEDQRA